MQVFKLPGLKGSSKFMFNSIKFFLINLFIYFWLCWVFVAACGRLSLVAASEGYSSLRCTGSRRAGFHQGSPFPGAFDKPSPHLGLLQGHPQSDLGPPFSSTGPPAEDQLS